MRNRRPTHGRPTPSRPTPQAIEHTTLLPRREGLAGGSPGDGSFVLLLFLALLLLSGCSADKTEHYYREALALADEGDAPQALERFRIAADHTRADTLLVAIHSEMGHLLFEEGLQEEAMTAFHKAYEVDCRRGDTLGMACDLRNMANVYRTREADDSCLVLFREAMRLAEAMGDSILLLDVSSQLAGYYLWHGRCDEARRLLMSALQAMPDNAGLRFMAADLYRHTGPRDSLLYYCSLLLHSESVVHRQMSHKWMADFMLKEGEVSKAMQHLEQYELLTDTIQQEIDTEAMRRTNALYDYTRQAQQSARLRLQLTVVVALAIVLASLLLAAAFWFSRRRMHYRLKVQQLELLLNDYSHHDEQADCRRQQILTQTPIYKHITQLLRDTVPKPLSDEDWHILADAIEKTHPQFQQRLQEFHHLSPQEWRITLLIKAGFAPADIARLTARSKQSVSSTRSRLYQKAFGRKGSPADWDEFVMSL